MEDKLHQFFSENEFDLQEPHPGHLARFEHKLNAAKERNKTSWKWLSFAASVILLLGFWLASAHQKKQIELADISPKMEEVQNYFVSSIHQELKTLEKNRSLETETIIENALDKLEDLEEDYQVLVKELTKNGKQRKLINAMIKNYQNRLDILEKTLKQIEYIKNPNFLENEIFI